MRYQFPLSTLLALMPVLVSSSPIDLGIEKTDLDARDSITKRSYWLSCSSCSIVPMRSQFGISEFLSCQCDPHTPGGFTWLNLDECLANRDGRFQWERNGWAFGSCNNVRLENGGLELAASCRNNGAVPVDARITLDRVHNINGVLVCSV
jgi:hypothetical protein